MMNDLPNNSDQSSSTKEPTQIGLVDLLIVFARQKKVIVGVSLASALLSGAVSLLMPDFYKSTVTMLPPQQQQSGAAALLSQLGGVAGAAASVTGLKNPNDMYVGMLKSRTVADNLIKKFKLKDVYEFDSLEKTRRVLAERTVVTAGKDGLITIEVEDADRKLTAPLANAYVSELQRLTRTLALTDAGKRRIFFEEQLKQAKDNLATAEAKLKGALNTHGVISVDIESRAIIETVGRLRAQISSKEIQLNAMNAFVTANNPEYRRVQEELNSLRSELSRLENGRNEATPASVSNEPSGLQNIKTLRDVKYYQMLYELLAKQYEAARLEEAKDPSIIQILDPAVEAERKSKPKRLLIILMSTFIGLIVGLMVALVRDAKRRAAQSPDTAAKMKLLKQHLRFR